MSDPVQVEHVTFRRGGGFAIRDLSMRIPQGAVYGLVGPNGAGKTTLMRLITGMARAEDGVVTVLGRRMPTEAAAAMAQVGFVPERPHLYPDLKVEELLRYHGAFYPTWDASYASHLLSAFGLRPGQVTGAMSKGETGKTMMVLALASRPRLLLLDEPTDGLDPVARREVMGSVMDYVAETGATMLITSHLIHEIERSCDWIGLLDNGQIVIEEPMLAFRDSLRRFRLTGAPAPDGALPFTLLSRQTDVGRHEEWIVRGHAEALAWATSRGASVLDVQPLDLEDVVVEWLRGARRAQSEVRR